MEIRHIAATLLRTVLVGLAISGAGENLQAESALHFRLVDGNLIVIALNSNRGTSYDFVFDTGTDTTVIDPVIAPELSFVPNDQIEVVSFSGTRVVPRGSVPKLSVGSAQLDDMQVLLQPLPELRRLDSHIVGILGQNFLANFNYLIDYRRHEIRFEFGNEFDGTIEGEHVAIESKEDRMLVASEVQSRASTQLNLVLDSGADSLVLLNRASQTLDLPRQATSPQVFSGGEVVMKMGKVRVLAVGSERLHDVAAMLPDSEPAVAMGDGLLPTALFRAVYINNRDGFVVFNPRITKKFPESR